MENYTILTYSDLKNVSAKDNGEDFVNLSKNPFGLICEYEKDDMVAILGNDIYVRESIYQKLMNAQLKLQEKNPNYVFRVVYGYRHPDIQKKYFERRIKILQEENPTLTEDELRELTHLFVAEPSVAGHPTGGAIDITIRNTQTKSDISMGTKIADFDQRDKIKTFYENLTPEEKNNRALLLEILQEEEFAPFYGEWWHFSYGDKEWAKFYNKEHAIFEQKKYPF